MDNENITNQDPNLEENQQQVQQQVYSTQTTGAAVFPNQVNNAPRRMPKPVEKTGGLVTSKLTTAQYYADHFGIILSNLAFVAAVILGICSMSLLIPAIYYLVLIMIVVVTFGTIFVSFPEFGKLFSAGNFLSEVALFMTVKLAPIMFWVALGLAAAAILFLCLKPRKRRWIRIGLCIAIVVIVLIVYFTLYMGGANV